MVVPTATSNAPPIGRTKGCRRSSFFLIRTGNPPEGSTSHRYIPKGGRGLRRDHWPLYGLYESRPRKGSFISSAKPISGHPDGIDCTVFVSVPLMIVGSMRLGRRKLNARTTIFISQAIQEENEFTIESEGQAPRGCR